MIAKIFTGLLLVYCVKKGRRFGNFFNPYYLVIPTLLSFIIYFPINDYYFASLAIETEALIVFSLSALILGFNVVFKNKVKPVTSEKHEINFPLIFIIGIIPTLLSFYLYGNTLDLEGSDLVEAREHTTLPVVGQLVFFLQASIVVACKKNKSSLILFAIISSFLASLFTASKTNLMITLLFTAGGLLTFTPNIMKSKMFLLLRKFWYFAIPIILVVMFMYNNNKRAGGEGVSEKEYAERGKATVEFGSGNLGQNLFLDYCYYCVPWSNLDYNLHHSTEYGYGSITMAQFAKKVGVTLKTPQVHNPTFFNTHSYITNFYLDFGYIGAIIVSFFLGIFIFFCYAKFGLSRDPMLISFYMLVSYATVMLFFSNHFTIGYLLNYFITFGFVSMLYRVNKR